MAGANVVISSVRGTDKPVYIAGARATGTYPMSVIMPGGGINITSFSNGGNIDVGITVDPDLVSDPWLLVEGLHNSLAEYLSMISKPTPKKKKASKGAKNKTTRKKRPAS